MIINKAILHIFDFISEVCIFSQKEIDLREDNINEFILHQAILPSTAQKVDSFAIIQKNSWYVRFIDKRRYIEGRDTYILPDVILQ